MKHKGVSFYRTKTEAKEKLFAEAWERQNKHGDTLNWLLDRRENQQGKPLDVSPRDVEVAATVIQWLGSNVGQAFLRDLGYNIQELFTIESGSWIFEEVPQVTLPRHAKGCDWGRERKLVLQWNASDQIFWVPGHSGWVSRGQSGYYAGTLKLDTEKVRYPKTLAEGGSYLKHINKDMSVRQKIAEAIGCAVWDLPLFKKDITYIVRKKK